MTKRVSPIERVRVEMDQLFAATERPLTEILEEVGRLSVRLVFQVAVEAEVEAVLGRARHQRRVQDGPGGYRNGYQPPATVKTTMGSVELCRPKLRDTDERFCSRLFGAGVTRTHGWSPISGPPGIRARLLLIWILVDVAGYGVMGVAALGSVFGRSAITQR